MEPPPGAPTRSGTKTRRCYWSHPNTTATATAAATARPKLEHLFGNFH